MSAIQPIVLFPDSRLRQKAQKITQFGSRLRVLVDPMVRIMRQQKHGIGLAAPQIGILSQIAVVDVSARVSGAKLHILVNPVVLEAKDEVLSHEGCMSLPEYTAPLKRYNRIKLEYWDVEGQRLSKWTEGIEAICMQHEIDHLNGILFLDRVVSLKTDMIPRHLKRRKPRKK